MAEDQPGVKSQSSARERFEARRAQGAKTGSAGPRKPRATPRTASPTRSIEPGIAHHRIAMGLLRGLRDRAQERGLSLDIGELPDQIRGEGIPDDPQRLERIVAHAVARTADRFTFVRKFSRHLEGSENRAGILSDLVAAGWELYKRNPDSFEEWGTNYAREVRAQAQARRAQASAAKAASNVAAQNGANQPTPGGVHATP